MMPLLARIVAERRAVVLPLVALALVNVGLYVFAVYPLSVRVSYSQAMNSLSALVPVPVIEMSTELPLQRQAMNLLPLEQSLCRLPRRWLLSVMSLSPCYPMMLR